MDHNVGLILDTLASSGLAGDTIVSFVADHGFQLGEHGQYGKNTNFEESVRVPWILHESLPNQAEQLTKYKYTDPVGKTGNNKYVIIIALLFFKIS